MSRLIRTQNRELSLGCITYNIHRLTNLIILMMPFYKAKIRVFCFRILFSGTINHNAILSLSAKTIGWCR